MKINCSFNFVNNPNARQNTIQKHEISSRPAFKGIFDIFKKQEKSNLSEQIFLDSNISILSPKQIKQAKEYAAQEVYSLIKSPYTPGASKKLDNLLNSPYIDYSLPVCGEYHFTLADCVDVRHKSTEKNELYNQFLRTSLAKTMPMNLLENEYKQELYSINHGIYQIFQDYTKADESSKESQEVRDMVVRLKEACVDIDDYPEFFADCLINGKTKMCKLLMENFNLTPETQVSVVRGNDRTLKEFSNAFGITNKLDDPYYSPSFYFDKNSKDSFLIVHPHRLAVSNTHSYAKYISSDVADTTTLYNIASLSPLEESKNFFDIPSYMCDNLAGRIIYTKYSYEDKDLTKEFFNHNVERHPELRDFEFLEKFATQLKAKKDKPLAYYLNSIESYIANKDNLQKAKDLIQELSTDESEKSQARLKIVQELHDFVAKRLS